MVGLLGSDPAGPSLRADTSNVPVEGMSTGDAGAAQTIILRETDAEDIDANIISRWVTPLRKLDLVSA